MEKFTVVLTVSHYFSGPPLKKQREGKVCFSFNGIHCHGKQQDSRLTEESGDAEEYKLRIQLSASSRALVLNLD